MKKIILGSAAGLIVSLVAASAFADNHGGKQGRGFEAMDTNGDGKVTAEELAEKRGDWIEKADANGDGGVTEEELKTYREARRAEWKEKRNPDTNGDGVVDKSEYMSSAEERFAKMDKNGDGVLSEDEKSSRRGHHRRGRH